VSSKKLDTTTKVGRLVLQMKDISVRMKPEARAVVIRLYNRIEENLDDPQLRFKVRDDLDLLGREPLLAGLAKRLFKVLPPI
jgi:hypothetical protein